MPGARPETTVAQYDYLAEQPGLSDNSCADGTARKRCSPRRETTKSLIEIRNVKSGDNKGTIRATMRYLLVSTDVRRHRLISSDYIRTLGCHGRGRGFESRRPRHSK